MAIWEMKKEQFSETHWPDSLVYSPKTKSKQTKKTVETLPLMGWKVRTDRGSCPWTASFTQ